MYTLGYFNCDTKQRGEDREFKSLKAAVKAANDLRTNGYKLSIWIHDTLKNDCAVLLHFYS